MRAPRGAKKSNRRGALSVDVSNMMFGKKKNIMFAFWGHTLFAVQSSSAVSCLQFGGLHPLYT
jgi:hypothetical protein